MYISENMFYKSLSRLQMTHFFYWMVETPIETLIGVIILSRDYHPGVEAELRPPASPRPPAATNASSGTYPGSCFLQNQHTSVTINTLPVTIKTLPVTIKTLPVTIKTLPVTNTHHVAISL